MASAARNVAAFAAEGDLEQQGTQKQNPARSPWLKMLYKGLMAFISLMLEALENDRVVTGIGLYQNDDALVDFSKAFITSKKSGLEIKYPNLQPILALYDEDPRTGDRHNFDAFLPDLNPKKAWIASDSVLHMCNSDKPKDFRELEEQWQENSLAWKPFVKEAVFCIRDCVDILDILEKIKAAFKDLEVGDVSVCHAQKGGSSGAQGRLGGFGHGEGQPYFGESDHVLAGPCRSGGLQWRGAAMIRGVRCGWNPRRESCVEQLV